MKSHGRVDRPYMLTPSRIPDCDENSHDNDDSFYDCYERFHDSDGRFYDSDDTSPASWPYPAVKGAESCVISSRRSRLVQ